MFPSCLYTNRVDERAPSCKNVATSLECTETHGIELEAFADPGSPLHRSQVAGVRESGADRRLIEPPTLPIPAQPKLGLVKKESRKVPKIDLSNEIRGLQSPSQRVEELEVPGSDLLLPELPMHHQRMSTEESSNSRSDPKDPHRSSPHLLRPGHPRSIRDASPSGLAKLGAVFSCNNLFAKQLKKGSSTEKSHSRLASLVSPPRLTATEDAHRDLGLAFKRCKSPSGRPQTMHTIDSTLRSARLKERPETDHQSFSRVSAKQTEAAKRASKWRTQVTPTSLSTCQSVKTFCANVIRPPEEIWVADKSRHSIENDPKNFLER